MDADGNPLTGSPRRLTHRAQPKVDSVFRSRSSGSSRSRGVLALLILDAASSFQDLFKATTTDISAHTQSTLSMLQPANGHRGHIAYECTTHENTGPPVECDYTPKGAVSKIGDLDAYFIGSGPKCLVVVYDIFGFSTQAKQVCDKFAAAGFNVVMPDFCEGKHWLVENFPPKDMSEVHAWICSTGDWDTAILPKYTATVAYMKEQKGADTFGLAGFCWGGLISMKAAAHGADGGLKATACCHPARLTPELAEKVTVPMLIMPSGEDPDHIPLKEVLDKKPFGDKCEYRRFDDMHHGFCAARGDWSIPEQATRAGEAIDMFVKFFKTHLAA